MDPVNLTYYACICGLLALLSDRLGGPLWRIVAGAAVGLAAAALLPLLKSAFGLP